MGKIKKTKFEASNVMGYLRNINLIRILPKHVPRLLCVLVDIHRNSELVVSPYE